MLNKKWSFLGNYRTEDEAKEVQAAHYNTWLDIYPHAKYSIEYQPTFCANYLLYVNLCEK